MWRFKQFIPKEHSGLEGRIVDIGNVKVHVRNILAEGGFSCVYIATDSMQPSKNYALKHMICNDEESLDLAKKEISVMKLLKGHPNIINLNGSAIFDMGRTKEVLLLMEFCEKSLVTVLENRGGGYFDEKQILLIFRDVCNGVFAMHCQSPSIAHRDLKAENVLLGADGAWKLCDFGSTSTNHKCFSRPEEMGIEEDVIRKHTTPAYRAPEMWDLYRREIISEKVDIWALGCLLYRICYLKSAFDGESKLQILNGNYRIPELPNYSSSLKDLIKDMLQSSPDVRPDITQVWFRVNLQLPEDLQKQMPNNVATNENHLGTANLQKEGISKKTSMVPRRSPPPPPSQKERSNLPQSSSKTEDNKAPVGAFWSTQHAFDFQFDKDSGPKQAPQGRTKVNPPPAARSVQQASIKVNDSPGEDFEIRFDKDGGFEEISGSKSNSNIEFSDKTFNAFVADFDHSKVNASPTSGLEAKVERLKEQLKEANLEKAEITSKYEKLSAICRSQRLEIQELKQALAAAKPKSDGCREHSSTSEREKIEGSMKELSDSILSSPSPSSNTNQWQPFSEPTARSARPRSVRTINGHNSISRNSNSPSSLDSWGFDQDKFVAASTSGPQVSTTTTRLGDSGGVRQTKPLGNQPTGWAGF